MSFYQLLSYFSLIALSLYNFSIEGALTATATVTYTIEEIDPISVSGNPAPLVISSATAGSQPSVATDSSTTWAVTSNTTYPTKVTGELAQPMPTGVTLSVNLQAPTGATSLGTVPLSTSPADLVTGIGNVAEGSLMITYTLAASVNATQVTGATNTVTFTEGP